MGTKAQRNSKWVWFAFFGINYDLLGKGCLAGFTLGPPIMSFGLLGIIGLLFHA